MALGGALADGGASLRVRFPGASRVARGALLAGFGLALALVLGLYVLAESVPFTSAWTPHDGAAPRTPARPAHLLPALLVLAFLGAAVLVAVRFDRAARRRPNAWVLAAGAFAALAAFSGMLAGNTVAYTGGDLSRGEARVGFTLLFAGYAIAFPLATIGGWRTWKGHGARSGWILVLYVTFHACVHAQLAWFGAVLPLELLGPTDAEARLAPAAHARADPPRPELVRPVLHVRSDGSVHSIGRELLGPIPDDDTRRLGAFLRERAARMRKQAFDPRVPGADLVPDDPLLVMAEADAPYDRVLGVLRLAAGPDVRIWKQQLGVLRPTRPWLGTFLAYAPRDVVVIETPEAPGVQEPALLRLEDELLFRWPDVPAPIDPLAPLGGAPRSRGLGPPEVLSDLEPGVAWRDVVRAIDESHHERPDGFLYVD